MDARTNPSRRIQSMQQRLLLPQTGADDRTTKAQAMARQLLAENAQLLRVLGAVLERVGPVELPVMDTDDGAGPLGVPPLFEVERYDANDGLSARWVGKRVRG